MIALISDIHSNREALDAVFAVIDRLPGVEKVMCLGDVVGYGPEPEYCVDLVRERCQVCLLGNHDEALFAGAGDFNPHARAAIEMTARRMRPGIIAGSGKRERWEYLRSRPTTHREGRWLFVHASPRDPVREYVLATDGLLNPDKMEAIFRSFDAGQCAMGHTHQPGIFRRDLRFEPPPPQAGPSSGEAPWVELSEREQALVNVGSVGQPRDGDNRACFATIDGVRVRWHRVPYDYATTMEKIRATPGLDEILARRLAIGR
ncbi:MAG TPA: metallophosphoesterase family protein [Planctomycetota bacterium]|nr:metallophosphoesterase family protein [Planctomycetota bacterium]